MKQSILSGIVLLCLACSTPDKTLSSEEKQKIIQEGKAVMNTVYMGAEKCDPAMMTGVYLNSPDFVSVINGVYYNYDQAMKEYPVILSGFKSQKPTILNEKYVVLDPTTMLYTANSKWLCVLKNDSVVSYEPVGFQVLLKKVDNQWKALSWVESY